MPRFLHFNAVHCCRSWNIEWVAPSVIGQYIFVIFCCGHPKLQIRPTYPYHWNVQVLTNVTVVCIRCMVLEIQLFFRGPSSWKHSATTFWNAWIKNNCISRTMQRIQTGLVPLRWWETVQQELTIELHLSAVRSSGLSLCFHNVTDYLCGVFLHVWVSDYWWCPSTNHLL